MTLAKRTEPVVYGKYQLLELLARGGMAEVFKAKSHGVEGFEKILVIKRILPELSENPEFVEMFVNEAKIAVTLSHANIVHVFDLGRAEDTYFIAMEYVAGMDLSTLVRSCISGDIELPSEISVAIVSEVAKALDYAHRRRGADMEPLNIVHRDVSPHNVLVSHEGEVKLTDFGIARARTTVQEGEGVLKGKYAYMSPEQARGEAVDGRADVFALGTVLYELLTGKNPFASESSYDTLKMVRRGECPSLVSLDMGIPEELSHIVARAMAPSLDDRFEDAGRFHEELIQYLFASGRRVGPQDISRLVLEIRDRKNAGAIDDGANVLLAAFASDSEVLEVGDAERTPVEVPESTRRPPDSTSGVSRPEKEWREITVVLVKEGSSAGDASSREELCRRFGGTPLDSDLLPEGERNDAWAVGFGLEEPDGQDTESAVRFAWRLRRMMAGDEGAAGEWGIGVHAGRVLFDALGEMHAEAEVDVLLAEAAAILETTETGNLALTKTAEEPIRRLFFVTPTGEHFVVDGERSETETVGQFIGRRDELKRIGELLAIASGGRQRVVIVEGEAGSGKSRLLIETGRRLTLGGHHVGMYVAQLSRQTSDLPFGALSEMLHVILGIDEFDPEPVVMEKVQRLRELGLSEADMAAVASTLGLSVEGDAGGSRRVLLAVGRIVTRLAEDRLSIFAFDGAEHMDAVSAKLLMRLIQESRKGRIAVIFAHRPVKVHEWLSLPGAQHISLGAMEDDDVARLTASRLNVEEVPMKLLRAVTIKSGGNPLYVEEQLKALADAGAIEVQDGEVSYDPAVAEIRVPKTLRGIIGARLSKLEPFERYLLQILSVLERGGTTPLVAQIAGETSDRTGATLTGLERRDFLMRDGTSEYRMAHALMSDVIREGLTIEALKAINLGAATAIENLFPNFRDEMAEKLAQHYRNAGNREKAVEYREVAVDRYVDDHAWDLALRNLEKAIDLVRGAPVPRTEKLLQLYQRAGEMCWRARIESKGVEFMSAAIELAEGLGRTQYVAAFSVLMGRLLAGSNRFTEAETWLTRGQQMARSLDDTELLREATRSLSDVHTRNGKYSRAIPSLLDVLRLAIDDQDARAELELRMNLALAYAGSDERETAMQHYDAAAKIVESTGDRYDEVVLLKNYTILGHFFHDHQMTIEVGARGIQLAKEYGLMYDAAAMAHNVGESYLSLGDYKRAFANIKYSYDVAVEQGFARTEYTNLRVLGFIDVMRFGSPEGRERVLEAGAFAREQGYLWDELQALHFLALVDHALGDSKSSKAGFREVIRLSAEYGNRQYEREAEKALAALESGQDVPMPS